MNMETYMAPDDSEPFAIGSFARACEEMNDFARSLQSQGIFRVVKPGADICYYDQCWRMQKWVEADLDRWKTACWFLELGHNGSEWVVESRVSVSEGDTFIELKPRRANSVMALQVALAEAVDELRRSLTEIRGFADEVAAILNAAD
jgi:hypothetical protein